MKTTVIVEMWDDRTISAYAPEFEGFSLNGQGKTVEEAKESLRQAVEDYKRALAEEGKAVPASLSGVEFDYQYDKASFFRELQARQRARGAEGEDGPCTRPEAGRPPSGPGACRIRPQILERVKTRTS